jgi:hypothetical protein
VTDALSGPHLWVLLVSLIYLAAVIASIVRAIRLPDHSMLTRAIWVVAIVMIPLGGLAVFWGAHWPKRRKKTVTP